MSVLGRQWDNSEVGQALRRDLGVKRVEPKQARHPRSGYRVKVGREVAEPMPGSSPPVVPVRDHGHLPNRANWGMGPDTVGERPLKHVYRGVSEADYQDMQRRGHIGSDGRGNIDAGEGTCATHDPRGAAVYGGDVKNFRVLKIAVHPDDGWAVDPRDGYIKTPKKVPLDRVVRVTRPLTSERGRESK